MKPKPIVGSSLVRARLLTTNCEVLDPEHHIQDFEAEITFEVNTTTQEKSEGASFDFFLDVTAGIVLHKDGKEVVKTKCKFRGDYVFGEHQYSPEEIVNDSPLFANQMILIIRPFLANIFSEMGINPVFLPFSIPVQRAPEETSSPGKKKKKK